MFQVKKEKGYSLASNGKKKLKNTYHADKWSLGASPDNALTIGMMEEASDRK